MRAALSGLFLCACVATASAQTITSSKQPPAFAQPG